LMLCCLILLRGVNRFIGGVLCLFFFAVSCFSFC